MYKKINEEDRTQKMQNILSKFSKIKTTVMSLKKVRKYNYY